jgi:hypothetical protein
VIKLTRTRTAAAVPAAFRGPGRVSNARDLIRLVQAGGEPKATVWKKAKASLRAESSEKCAYCESSTSTVAHGDVEHFRPKGIYWWLAYCFDNYTFSCQICNQSYKGSNFPHSGPALPTPAIPLDDAAIEALAQALAPDPLDDAALGVHRAALAREKAHLPDPYADDPELLFAWFSDPVLKEVEVRARTNRVVSKRAHDAAVRFLGLNRDELKRRRYQVMDLAKGLADLLRTPGLPPEAAAIATGQLKKMMQSDSEYAAMVRYFVNTTWQLGIAP